MKIILASGSPRRKELLAQAGKFIYKERIFIWQRLILKIFQLRKHILPEIFLWLNIQQEQFGIKYQQELGNKPPVIFLIQPEQLILGQQEFRIFRREQELRRRVIIRQEKIAHEEARQNTLT